MKPDWDDEDAEYHVKSMLGDHCEIWGGYWDEKEKSFICWMPADAAREFIDQGKLRDYRRVVARYLEAKDLGLIERAASQ